MRDLPLFANKKEFFVLMGAVVCIAFISLLFEFYRYQSLVKESLHVGKATVLNHYRKTNDKGKTYDVLKLKLDLGGAEVYTTSWRAMDVTFQSRVKVKLKVDKVTFYDYVKGFYAPNLSIYEIYEDAPPWNAKAWYRFIAEQHENEKLAELYQTLFFATPISKELRDEVQKWGISHLIAISGYNVGVISFLLFFFLRPIYRFFQRRYFPYRNATFDLSCIVFGVLFGYMVVLDFMPSFLRAFAMSVFGFFLFSRGIKLLSFGTLGLTSLFLLALFPSLWFSLSFWFSVAGVFYLFLLLHHFGTLPKGVLVLIVDLGVFFLMLPLVHTFFPVFTFLQLTTPITSLVFVAFYPLGVVLHVMGYGGVLDDVLLAFLSVPSTHYFLNFPVWFLALFVLLSLGAIRFKSLVFVWLGLSGASLFLIQ